MDHLIIFKKQVFLQNMEIQREKNPPVVPHYSLSSYVKSHPAQDFRVSSTEVLPHKPTTPLWQCSFSHKSLQKPKSSLFLTSKGPWLNTDCVCLQLVTLNVEMSNTIETAAFIQPRPSFAASFSIKGEYIHDP